MSLYNSDYLKRVVRGTTLQKSQRLFSETKIRSSFDIFLSHSYLDKDEVEGLFIELTDMGFSVYVDWIVDPNLDRANVTKETATLIRNRLRSSKSLMLAVSVNASVSKWMPWELGYMDGYNGNCCILPVSRDSIPPKAYKGVEYLSLYPFVTKDDLTIGDKKLLVVENSNKFVDLDNLIKGQRPTLKSRYLF